MQLLKSEMFKKTNHINVFTISNVHISLSEEKESDNKQKKIIIFKFNNINSHEEQSLEKL